MAIAFEVFGDDSGVATAGRVAVYRPKNSSDGRLIQIGRNDQSGLYQIGAVITGYQNLSAVNIAVQHMVGGDIYGSVFGNRVTQLSISGQQFTTTCDEVSGLAGLLRWYQENNAARRSSPVEVTILPDFTYDALLVSMTTGINNPQLRTAQFSMQLLAMPDPRHG